MSRLSRVWRWLTVPRSLPGRGDHHGAPGLATRRGSRSGIALVVVMTTVMILTVVVSDLAYTSRVRFLVTAHRQEERQAFWLANSGIQLYRLILAANMELASSLEQFADYLPFPPGDALWQMVPSINTGLLTMLLANEGGVDLEDSSQEDKDRFQQTGQVSDDLRQQALEEGGGLFSERSWLDLPGDMSAEVAAEDCRINVNLLASSDGTDLENSPTFQLLLGRMSGEDNDKWLRDRNLDARELISNLADWVDADTLRSGSRGGYEDSLYQDEDPPYLSKNAPFDTQDEIRLVDGWTDEVYDRFGGQFTIYGNGKINIGCGDDQIHWAILKSSYVNGGTLRDNQVNDIIDQIHDQELVIGFSKPKDYVDFLTSLGLQVDNELLNHLSDQSLTFRIVSTGMVGNSTATIEEVVQYTKRGKSRLLYHRVL